MKCFPILLLVSLASPSLAILNEQDEIHLEPQPTHACKSHVGHLQTGQHLGARNNLSSTSCCAVIEDGRRNYLSNPNASRWGVSAHPEMRRLVNLLEVEFPFNGIQNQGCAFQVLIDLDAGMGPQFSPATQLIPEKNHVSTENSSEETPISSEELGFEEEDVIKSTRRPKSQKLELLHPIPPEASFRNAAPQSEGTTELTLRADRSQGRGEEAGREATTPEGTLAELGHKIGKNLDKTVKETVNYVKSLLPHAYEVTRP
ncbi:PREDICTED: uncharacterized protein LOC101379925 [Odobenus rosmarus divergens]|uniref:Glycosylation-dependent cell adhesion molecule 1 n=1 Tax=Odobenus rosmarus divergens TaxID=9708 RepID=A0A9B0LU34_ODORO